VALVFFAMGCTSEERREELAVLSALDALRGAPSEDLAGRKKLIDALRMTRTSTERGIAARDTCVGAYSLLVEGKESTAKVKAALAGRASGTALLDAAQELLRAEQKIKDSEEAMTSCEKASGALRLSRH